MGEWRGEEVGFREDSYVQTTELTPHNESTGGWETRSGEKQESRRLWNPGIQEAGS